MYRIQLVCVTSVCCLVGCGSPSESQFYDLDKRLSESEKQHQAVAEQLTRSLAESKATSDSLVTVQQKVDARLKQIESALNDLKEGVQEVKASAADFKPSFDPSEMDQRLKALESKVASTRAENSERSLIPTRDVEPKSTNSMEEAELDSPAPKRRRASKMFQTTLFSWNVESEGSDPKVIAQQLSEMNRYDVYGLSEVLPEAIDLFTDALGSDYRAVASRSGFNDRLQIIYNTKVFRLLRRLELSEINYQRRYRSPLVAHLEHKKSGQQIMVINNHLARGRAEVRTKQAQQLVEWARDQSVPIVAIGDYNFDYVFRTRKGNDGFNAMLKDNIWQWVEPVELIDTNWFDNPKRPDGRDDYEGSMLDFAFVAGAATKWNADCRVIVRPGDFPDDETTSDHRPFELKLSTR